MLDVLSQNFISDRYNLYTYITNVKYNYVFVGECSFVHNTGLHFLSSDYARLPYLGCCGEKEIITDKSLDAIRELVIVLRTNVQMIGHGWVFRAGAAIHQGVVQEILIAIRKGQTSTVRSMLEAGWRLESAQALYLFLTSLPRPLVPPSIQALVLDDNGNVPVDVVATDVLGLMKQELPDKHLKLISLLLNLLDTVIKFSPADELRGNTLPISMLPLFFDIQTQHMQEWRRIVTIFVELIRQAGHHLEMPELTDNVRLSGNTQIQETNPMMEEPMELGENMVVRTFLIPVGHRGDCNCLETYRIGSTNND